MAGEALVVSTNLASAMLFASAIGSSVLMTISTVSADISPVVGSPTRRVPSIPNCSRRASLPILQELPTRTDLIVPSRQRSRICSSLTLSSSAACLTLSNRGKSRGSEAETSPSYIVSKITRPHRQAPSPTCPHDRPRRTSRTHAPHDWTLSRAHVRRSSRGSRLRAARLGTTASSPCP